MRKGQKLQKKQMGRDSEKRERRMRENEIEGERKGRDQE